MMVNLKNPTREFKNFIKTIPKSFSEYFFFWNEEDMKKIKNSFFYNLILHRTDQLYYTMEMIKKSTLKEKGYTLDDLKFAYISVCSRNFNNDVGNKSYVTLGPFVDLFNTSPEINARWSYKLNSIDDNFTLNSTKNIHKGEEIIITYGSDYNAKYLEIYGFTLENNPFKVESPGFLLIDNNNNYIYNKIDEVNSSHLIDILKNWKDKNPKNKEKNSNEKEDKNKNKIIEEDLELFKIILGGLSKYKNTQMIKQLRENINKSSNNQNILRILEDEDKLININIYFTEEFIEILKGGKEKLALMKKKKSIVVRQNEKYFHSLFY